MPQEPVKIAILAMGGEGGGVLANWIVDLAEENGWFAQTTSVPGVAQRTGATIYYVELYPGAHAPGARTPVLAQAPMPGDVDIVLASELMEAGRAVQRGLVTPDRTTLIASTHRVYAIAEKSAMGDGRSDSSMLLSRIQRAARRLTCFDMAAAAEEAGSVVNAVLFGALCGTGALAFDQRQFEATIERGGIGVASSLRAFALGFGRASESRAEDASGPPVGTVPASMTTPRHPQAIALLERTRRLPVPVQGLVLEGVRRLIDYQDHAYAHLYIDRLDALARAPGGDNNDLLGETARHLALWMSYEDTIRVADLKTRDSRFTRVCDEVHALPGQVLEIEEFMHPRVEEISETLPAAIGKWLSRPNLAHRIVAHFTRKGRVVRTSTVGGFLLLHILSGLRRWRRATWRHALENERINEWLARIHAMAAIDPGMAIETARCQRLVKGYGDTHARGLKNYHVLMAALDRNARSMTPATLHDLREAALADEHGDTLHQRLRAHGLLAGGAPA